MKLHNASRIRALLLCFGFCILTSVTPVRLAAQEQPAEESAPGGLWPWLKEGTISFNARYRLEGFERDGAPFTDTAYAPTLRLALGYETPAWHGLSVFAQGEAVFVTGPADYSVPALPSQNRPNLPAILDPRSLEFNQGYLRWDHGTEHKKVAVAVGRQEIALNDGRFLSFSTWRQVHGSFDAARMDADLPLNFSFTYAFINKFYREDGYNATDGEEPMHTDMVNLKWNKPGRVSASLYGLLLDFRGPAQFATSTQTYGLRLTGPYQFNPDWSLLYVAEFAKQLNYGTNPYKVNENYFLGEIGPGWRDFGFKAGYAFLGGRSATDLLTTPLAPPRNGWTDLFFSGPYNTRRPRTGSRISDWQRTDSLARWNCRDAALLRLSFGLSAHSLWQRTRYFSGIQNQTNKQSVGDRLAVWAVLGGPAFYEFRAHFGVYELHALVGQASSLSGFLLALDQS